MAPCCSSEKVAQVLRPGKKRLSKCGRMPGGAGFSKNIVLSLSVFPNSTALNYSLLHFISRGLNIELFCNHDHLLLQDVSVFYFYNRENTAILTVSLDLRTVEHVWVKCHCSLLTVLSLCLHRRPRPGRHGGEGSLPSVSLDSP